MVFNVTKKQLSIFNAVKENNEIPIDKFDYFYGYVSFF